MQQEEGGLVMANTASCVGVVLVVARVESASPSLLFLRRSGGQFAGQWWPVTGTLRLGESPLAGALRELAEETGLTPDAIYDTGLCAPLADGRGVLQVIVAIVPPAAEVMLNWEHSEHQWCSLSEAQALIPDVARGYLAEAERVARIQPIQQKLFSRGPVPAA